MHELTIQDSAGDVVVVPLQHDRISVGRQEGNVVRLTDQNVSRKHARLFRQDGEYFIEDLASYIGTVVNGVRISDRTALHDGDSVTIGEYCLTFRLAGSKSRSKAKATKSTRPTSRPVCIVEQRPCLRGWRPVW